MTYREFQSLGIDLAPLGVEMREENISYFCTPKGAQVLGWAGVDGIHYCQIESLGETVFAVTPMALPGEYVRPIAANLDDFLRLLLACGDAAALDQAGGWSEAQFDSFLQENQPTREQRGVLQQITERTGLQSMPQPYGYIHSLQEGFDASCIPWSEEYYEVVPPEPEEPEWQVYYHGNFWGHHGSEAAGEELFIGKRFAWGEEIWDVPAVYVCRSGLVLDLCARVEPERIRAFMEKWDLSADTDEGAFSEEALERIRAENPLNLDIDPVLLCNGTEMSAKSSSCMGYLPEELDVMEQNGTAQQVLAHYGLDPAFGWSLHRVCFAWDDVVHVQILELNMAQERVTIPGPHFSAREGEQIGFVHPVSGAQHSLLIHSLEWEELEQARFGNDAEEYPNHYVLMEYSVQPPLSHSSLSVLDCEKPDAPRYKRGGKVAGAAAIGIIDVADGPTTIMVGKPENQARHAACSALRFAPREEVHWRIVFHEKLREDLTVELF